VSIKTTQPSIPPGQKIVCLARIKTGRVHLCQTAGNTVISYGRWCSV